MFTKPIELGYKAVEFSLLEPLTGKIRKLTELKGDVATVIMFICNHCPYVKHINRGLVELANDYIDKGVSFIAINPNDVDSYPDDSPEKMVEVVKNMGYPFPYLYDETQNTAKDYQAVCTPDFSIFNKKLECIYRGQLDESRPGSDIAVTGKDIRKVLDAVLQNREIDWEQVPSAGCSIKWRQ
jgi:thiol-disulfide isomerase/thioredoxin